MLKQLGLIDLLSAVQKVIEDNTKLKCYDSVPTDAISPFYFAEIVGKRASHSKTMFKDTFTVWIHAIAEPNDSSVMIYQLIQELEESLTDDILLPDGYEMVLQTNNGIQTIKTDETNEKHAVLEFQFTVCYGFKSKI